MNNSWTDRKLGVSVLGDFQVLRDGHRHEVPTRQVARLGALLAAEPRQPFTRERIVQALWADKPPHTAVNTVHVHISQLRSHLGSELVLTTGQGYALAIDDSDVDAQWFRERVLGCIDQSEGNSPTQVRETLLQAIELWRGEPYEDLRDAGVKARRSELQELLERAQELYLEVSLKAANSAREIGEVVAAARGQVARQPLRERGYEVLIRALIRENDHAQAAQVYRHAVEVFADQAGVGPSPRLRELIEMVLEN